MQLSRIPHDRVRSLCEAHPPTSAHGLVRTIPAHPLLCPARRSVGSHVSVRRLVLLQLCAPLRQLLDFLFVLRAAGSVEYATAAEKVSGRHVITPPSTIPHPNKQHALH
jgi:hypothetical protein